MITRIDQELQERLKKIANRDEFGSLRALFTRIFETFLREKPYLAADAWVTPKADAKPFNVVLPEALTMKIRKEALRRDVNIIVFLLSGLTWGSKRFSDNKAKDSNK